jgi:hypothetical protein
MAVERIHEPGGDRGRAGVELLHVVAVGEVVRVADDEERDRLVGLGRGESGGGDGRAGGEELAAREVVHGSKINHRVTEDTEKRPKTEKDQV